MARLLLILVLCAGIVTLVTVLAYVSRKWVPMGSQQARGTPGIGKDDDMASSGLKKAAFVALLLVLFGVSTGWLGGL